MDEWGYVVVVVAIAVLVSLREETLAGITKTVVVIACRMLFGVGDGFMVRNEEKSLVVFALSESVGITCLLWTGGGLLLWQSKEMKRPINRNRSSLSLVRRAVVVGI